MGLVPASSAPRDERSGRWLPAPALAIQNSALPARYTPDTPTQPFSPSVAPEAPSPLAWLALALSTPQLPGSWVPGY